MSTTSYYEDLSPEAAPWGANLLLGILWLTLGVIALTSPTFVTIATTLLIGWVLLFAGIFQTIHTLWNWRSAKVLSYLFSVILISFGILLLTSSFQGALAATSLIALFFLIQGTLFLSVAALERKNIWFVVTNGIFSLVFGFIIFSNLVESSEIVIGILIGVQMILHGFHLVAISTFASPYPNLGRIILGALVLVFILGVFFHQLLKSLDKDEPAASLDSEEIVELQIHNLYLLNPDVNETDLRTFCESIEGRFNNCGPTQCQIASLYDSNVVCTNECAPACLTPAG